MAYSFTCYGHENITARHKTTLEFTKDTEISLEGDCIVGVRANFSLVQLKKFINLLGNNKKITIIIETTNNNKEFNNKKHNKLNNINNKNNIEKNKIDNNYKNKLSEKINAEINPDFNSDKDIVIRKSGFIDERTFAINADKAACDIGKELAACLKSGGKVKIEIITY